MDSCSRLFRYLVSYFMTPTMLDWFNFVISLTNMVTYYGFMISFWIDLQFSEYLLRNVMFPVRFWVIFLLFKVIYMSPHYLFNSYSWSINIYLDIFSNASFYTPFFSNLLLYNLHENITCRNFLLFNMLCTISSFLIKIIGY